MSDRSAAAGRALDPAAAAELLGLPPEAVHALADAGYLQPIVAEAGRLFPLFDLKGFLARNAGDEDHPSAFFEDPAGVDPAVLIAALDGRAPEMAVRTFEIFSAVFPETAQWTDGERTRFVDQAERRFEAILAVTSMGEVIDDALVDDLRDIGAAAARSRSPLPELLVILRISRDLVVQTAVELAEEQGRHWGLALALLLTRVLPAIDRLTDSLAQGYWASVVDREEDARARYENVVEHASDGVYEVDLDGTVIFANRALAKILGRRRDDIVGARLGEILSPIGGGLTIEALTSEATAFGQDFELEVAHRDGAPRVLRIRAFARFRQGDIAGYQAVVHDATSERAFEARKNELLRLLTHDLRQPLTTVLGLGVTLRTYAEELDAARVAHIGSTIHGQAERMARLADDLHDVSKLATAALLVHVREVQVEATVRSALATTTHAGAVEVRIDGSLRALADARRLEQIVANLVENAFEHGSPPVVVSAWDDDGDVIVSVEDHGDGIPSALVATLFSRFPTFGRRGADAAKGSGIGLSLVRGLVEAMDGRVWYQPLAEGGSAFRLRLRGTPVAAPR